MKFGAFLIVSLLIAPLRADVRAPETVAQGQFIHVEYDAAKPIGALTATFLTKDMSCYPDPNPSADPGKKNLWHCLIAVAANAPEGPQELELCDSGTTIHKRMVNIAAAKYPIEDLPLTKEKKDLVDKGDTPEEKKRIRAALGSETAQKFWQGEFVTPVKGRVESHYGERRRIGGKLREGYYHRGTDFKAPKGAPMIAANAGRVVLAGPFTEEGNMVMIDHGHGIVSAYLHCSRILVKEGQTVQRGERIALVGSTGVSNSDHLHLGIYLHGTPIDPLIWLNRKLPY